ncbi:hypothetical protein, partial [Nocardia heshunensis]
MKFNLTDSKNKTFALPVNPAEINVESTTDDKTITVVKLGEISLIGPEKVKTIELTSTIPVKTTGVHYLSTSKPYKNGQTYIDKINKMYKAKKPIRLVGTTTKIS